MIHIVSSAIIQHGSTFLFVKETKPSAADKWGLPGGKLEEGESLVECVRREVLEETGYTVTTEQLLCVVNKPHSNEGNTIIKCMFVCAVASDPALHAEHEYAWLTAKQVHTLHSQGLIRGDEIPELLQESQQPIHPAASNFLRIYP